MTAADLDYVQPYGVTPLRGSNLKPASARQLSKATEAAAKAGAKADRSLAALRAVSQNARTAADPA